MQGLCSAERDRVFRRQFKRRRAAARVSESHERQGKAHCSVPPDYACIVRIELGRIRLDSGILTESDWCNPVASGLSASI